MRIITSLICLYLCAPALAGQLAPPAGPVSPTMKTLVDVEPRTLIGPITTPGDATAVFVISRPGSYYLTENLTGVAGKDGIRVRVSGVTIDLNGFACLGVANSRDAIHVDFDFFSPISKIAIHSGTISNWGGDGVDADGSDNCTLRNLLISDNGGTGVFLNNGCVVEGVISRNNAIRGLDIGFQAIVRNCNSSHNGSDGILTLGEGFIIECIGFNNGSDGIECGVESIVINCLVRSNGLNGILAGVKCQVIDSHSVLNNRGILVGDDTIVRGCLVEQNDGHGIMLASRCIATGNHAYRNGFALAPTYGGIFAAVGSKDGVIDGNTVIGNEVGIWVPDINANWTIVRNNTKTSTFSGFIVAAGNPSGLWVVNPAIAGPWDNLSN